MGITSCSRKGATLLFSQLFYLNPFRTSDLCGLFRFRLRTREVAVHKEWNVNVLIRFSKTIRFEAIKPAE